jgi:hypothetical protein
LASDDESNASIKRRNSSPREEMLYFHDNADTYEDKFKTALLDWQKKLVS